MLQTDFAGAIITLNTFYEYLFIFFTRKILSMSHKILNICNELDEAGFGVRVPEEQIIFTSSYGPDRIWGPPSLLSSGFRG
jgi:hypothetical protein